MNTIHHSIEATEYAIHLNRQAGWLRIHSPHVFRPERRGFCRLIIDKAVMIPSVLSAGIDLSISTLRLQFELDCDIAELSKNFADALRAAQALDAAGVRSAPRWDMLAAFRTKVGVTFWEARTPTLSRLDLRWSPNPANHLNLILVIEQLAQIPGVQACRMGYWPHRLLMDYDASAVTAFDLLYEARQRWADSDSIVDTRYGNAAGRKKQEAAGLRRIPYFFLAGGCFVLTLGGLLLPGVPTVPFLVATSFFLARASSALHERLLNAPVLGHVLCEWERYRGLSAASKGTLVQMSSALVLLSVALDPLDPIALALTLLFASIAFYSTSRIPQVPLSAGGQEDSVPEKETCDCSDGEASIVAPTSDYSTEEQYSAMS